MFFKFEITLKNTFSSKLEIFFNFFFQKISITLLLAMEKSKSSINSTKNGRRLTLPDRDSSNVIKRFLEDRGDLSFDKVFEEKIGYALFVTFCSKKHAFSVPIVFYQQIEGNFDQNYNF